jgi:hypothetical protein
MFYRLLFVFLYFFFLVIVLSVLLRFTDSEYPFGIFKLFLWGRYCIPLLCCVFLLFVYVCLSSVSSAWCYICPWIVYSWLTVLFSLMFMETFFIYLPSVIGFNCKQMKTTFQLAKRTEEQTQYAQSSNRTKIKTSIKDGDTF